MIVHGPTPGKGGKERDGKGKQRAFATHFTRAKLEHECEKAPWPFHAEWGTSNAKRMRSCQMPKGKDLSHKAGRTRQLALEPFAASCVTGTWGSRGITGSRLVGRQCETKAVTPRYRPGRCRIGQPYKAEPPLGRGIDKMKNPKP